MVNLWYGVYDIYDTDVFHNAHMLLSLIEHSKGQ